MRLDHHHRLIGNGSQQRISINYLLRGLRTLTVTSQRLAQFITELGSHRTKLPLRRGFPTCLRRRILTNELTRIDDLGEIKRQGLGKLSRTQPARRVDRQGHRRIRIGLNNAATARDAQRTRKATSHPLQHKQNLVFNTERQSLREGLSPAIAAAQFLGNARASHRLALQNPRAGQIRTQAKFASNINGKRPGAGQLRSPAKVQTSGSHPVGLVPSGNGKSLKLIILNGSAHAEKVVILSKLKGQRQNLTLARRRPHRYACHVIIDANFAGIVHAQRSIKSTQPADRSHRSLRQRMRSSLTQRGFSEATRRIMRFPSGDRVHSLAKRPATRRQRGFLSHG